MMLVDTPTLAIAMTLILVVDISTAVHVRHPHYSTRWSWRHGLRPGCKSCLEDPSGCHMSLFLPPSPVPTSIPPPAHTSAAPDVSRLFVRSSRCIGNAVDPRISLRGVRLALARCRASASPGDKSDARLPRSVCTYIRLIATRVVCPCSTDAPCLRRRPLAFSRQRLEGRRRRPLGLSPLPQPSTPRACFLARGERMSRVRSNSVRSYDHAGRGAPWMFMPRGSCEKTAIDASASDVDHGARFADAPTRAEH